VGRDGYSGQKLAEGGCPYEIGKIYIYFNGFREIYKGCWSV
jgi:hypothetical protein